MLLYMHLNSPDNRLCRASARKKVIVNMEMPHYTPSDHVMYVQWGRGTTKWLAIFELGVWLPYYSVTMGYH